MNATWRSLLVIVLLLFTATVFAGVYRWVDSGGNVHYGDSPPPQSDAKTLSIDTGVTKSLPASSGKTAQPKKAAGADKQDSKKAQQAAKAKRKKLLKRATKVCADTQKHLDSMTGIHRLVKHNPDGTTSYLSGQDLVNFKKTLHKRHGKACTAAQKLKAAG